MSDSSDYTTSDLHKRELAANIAKLKAEKKAIEDESLRAAYLHELQLEKYQESDGKKSDKWALLKNPAFVGFLATVIAAFLTFLPQIINFRAIYDKAVIEEQTKVLKEKKELLESQREFQTEVNESIISSNSVLIARQIELSSTNTQILLEVARQNSVNADLVTNLTNLKEQIQISMLDLNKVKEDQTNLLTLVEKLRIESRQKELLLIEKDRFNAMDRLRTHLSDLEKEYGSIEWNKKPADIANLIASPWRTNILNYLADEVIAKTNYSARTRFAAAFVLYHENNKPPALRNVLLGMIRSGEASRFSLIMNFGFIERTNRIGEWHVEDIHDVWSACFEALCNSPENSDVRRDTLRLFSFNDFSLKQVKTEAFQNLATNFCDAKAIFHNQALSELETIDQQYAEFRSGFRFILISDPLLLAVMTAKKLAALPVPVNTERMTQSLYGYMSVAEALGYYGLKSDSDLKNKFLKLGLPNATGSNGIHNPTLYPVQWRDWVSNTNNTPLIEAALSTNLSAWDALIAQRIK